VNKKGGHQMPKKVNPNKNKVMIGVIICIIAVVGIALGVRYGKSGKKTPKTSPETVSKSIQSQNVIDYNSMEKDKMLRDLMTERKEERGVGDSIDIIAKSDESVKVGKSTIPMQEIMEKIQLKVGDIVEKNIQGGQNDPSSPIKEFGIYVVQPGDSIWNVHFNFLKDYFDRKGIPLSPLSDEPKNDGSSSGVGKILKFSENIVYIYNMETRDLDMDLNMIQPLNKLVVYNMDRIFSLLEQIDYSKVDRIEFDGETLWLPAEE
jgi:hypothetical protein